MCLIMQWHVLHNYTLLIPTAAIHVPWLVKLCSLGLLEVGEPTMLACKLQICKLQTCM